MDFLHSRVFDPILASPQASNKLKNGIRYTVMQMNALNAKGMVHYYWSAIIGTDQSISFSSSMKQEGFARFEEALEEFRIRFNDRFLNRPIAEDVVEGQ